MQKYNFTFDKNISKNELKLNRCIMWRTKCWNKLLKYYVDNIHILQCDALNCKEIAKKNQ
jgi:hypothetical protein